MLSVRAFYHANFQESLSGLKIFYLVQKACNLVQTCNRHLIAMGFCEMTKRLKNNQLSPDQTKFQEIRPDFW